MESTNPSSLKKKKKSLKRSKTPKMKVIAIVLITFALAFADPDPCCAPDQFSSAIRSFDSNGKYVDIYTMVDFVEGRFFESVQDDPDTATYYWYFDDENLVYIYNTINGDCKVIKESVNVTQFCVGTDDQTYDGNITLGYADAYAYSYQQDKSNILIVSDAILCIPILIQIDPIAHIGQNQFIAMQTFFNGVDNVDNFPELPSACDSATKLNKVPENLFRSRRFF